MTRRPLTIAVAGVVFCIFFWYLWHPPQDSYTTLNVACKVSGRVKSVSDNPNGRSITLQDVETQGKRENITCQGIIVYIDSKRSDDQTIQIYHSLKIGNTILLEGNLSSFSLPGNPGQFNEYLYYKQQNIDFRMFAKKCQMISSDYNKYKHFLSCVRERFFYAIKEALPEKEAGIIGAMILGEKSLLSEDTKNLYQQCGISHLLAISGV